MGPKCRQYMAVVAFVTGAFFAAGAQSQSTGAMISDGGFDTQGGSVADYCYFPSACPTGVWSGTSGLARQGINYTWHIPATASPPMVAFIQNKAYVQQTVTATKTGYFRVTFLMAGRPQVSGNQTVNVTVNGTSIGSFQTTTDAPFAGKTTGAFAMTSGQTYVLRFAGANATDDSALIDLVQLVDADLVADGGFDVQGGSVANYCYLSTDCPVGPWSGTSGMARQGASYTWQAPTNSSPPITAFVQKTRYVQQTITATKTASYHFTFLMAGRPVSGGNQTVNVTISGTAIGSFSTTTGAPFTSRTTSAFAMTNGQSYTLRFTGTKTTDESAFIDLVKSVEEPPVDPPVEPPVSQGRTYKYDALGRLIKTIQATTGTSSTTVYNLDKADNRTSTVTTSP